MAEDDDQLTALDFATRTVFAVENHAEMQSEVRATLKELVDSFGAAEVAQCLGEIGLAPQCTGDERVLQALRGFAVLIMDDDRPKLVAALVGKLAKLELATGRALLLSDLGRTHGMSKQATSKKLAHLARRLGLPRPDSSERARNSHRLMNRRNYARPTTPTLAS